MNIDNLKNYLLENKWRTGAYSFIILAVILYILSQMSQSNTMGISSGGSKILSMPSVSTDSVGGMDSYRKNYAENTQTTRVGDNGTYTDVAPKDRKIVRNGSISMVVKNTDEAVDQIEGVATRAGGFVQNKNVSQSAYVGATKAGSIVVRVPVESFGTTVAEIKKLAVRVTSENSTNDDVTRQYVDLEAQIKNLKAEEVQYQEIMKKAEKVADILQVSQYLAGVRGHIEQMESQMKYLSSEVAMSTISVNLTSEADTKIFGIYWSPLNEIKRAINGMISDLVEYLKWVIAFLFTLPVFILKVATWALILWAIWKVFVFVRNKYFRKTEMQ